MTSEWPQRKTQAAPARPGQWWWSRGRFKRGAKSGSQKPQDDEQNDTLASGRLEPKTVARAAQRNDAPTTPNAHTSPLLVSQVPSSSPLLSSFSSPPPPAFHTQQGSHLRRSCGGGPSWGTTRRSLCHHAQGRSPMGAPVLPTSSSTALLTPRRVGARLTPPRAQRPRRPQTVAWWRRACGAAGEGPRGPGAPPEEKEGIRNDRPPPSGDDLGPWPRAPHPTKRPPGHPHSCIHPPTNTGTTDRGTGLLRRTRRQSPSTHRRETREPCSSWTGSTMCWPH